MWEKLKLYTKVTIFGALALYVLAFIILNHERKVDGDLKLIFTSFNQPSILMVLPITGILSIFAWWLVRTIFKTMRQFRAMRERGRTAKLEKDLAEMKAKASMLQTREAAATSTIPPSPKPITPAADVSTSTDDIE